MESIRDFLHSNIDLLVEPHIQTRIIIEINPRGIKKIYWEREQSLGSAVNYDSNSSIDFNAALNNMLSMVEDGLNQLIKKKYGKLEITYGGV